MSHSQFAQDEWVVKHKPTPGYFIDIGAAHPTNWSNTYLLEQQGWRGLAIDPLLNQALWRKHRPYTQAIQRALSNDGAQRAFAVSPIGDLSGFVDSLDCWRDTVMAQCQVLQLPSMKVLELAYTATSNLSRHWDYVSLDVEGAELEILQAWPWDHITVDLWTIEHNFQEPRRSQIHQYMTEHHYILDTTLGVDDCYIHRTI